MSLSVIVDLYSDHKRINKLTFQRKNRTILTARYIYGTDNVLTALQLKGRESLSVSELLRIVNQRFIDNIENIENIESVRLAQDYAAKEGTDVDEYAGANMLSGAGTQLMSYSVPSGKTLLIYDWSAMLDTADGQICAFLRNTTTAAVLAVGGGQRGFQTPFSKPKRIPAGEGVNIFARQDSGAMIHGCGHIGGELIDA